jgi:hypothetical protein
MLTPGAKKFLLPLLPSPLTSRRLLRRLAWEMTWPFRMRFSAFHVRLAARPRRAAIEWKCGSTMAQIWKNRKEIAPEIPPARDNQLIMRTNIGRVGFGSESGLADRTFAISGLLPRLEAVLFQPPEP